MLNYIRLKLRNVKFLRPILSPLNQYFIVKPKIRRMNKMYSKYGHQSFAKVCDVLLANNIMFWPEFGTLLGIYRDNDFIKHDNDFDFGIYAEDHERVKSILIQSGLKLVHEYEGIGHPEIREFTCNYLGVNIDFFCFVRGNNSIKCHLFSHNSTNLKGETTYRIKEFVFPEINLIKTSFKGFMLTIPEDTNSHLIISYGPKYMTPDPNFKSINNKYLDILAKCIQY